MLQKPIVTAFVLAFLAPALALVAPPKIGLCQQQEDQQEEKSSEQETRPVVSVNLPGEGQTSPYVSCQIELSPADAKPGEIVTLSIRTTVVEGWHIYPLASKDGEETGYPTAITFEPSGLVAVDESFTASKKPKVSVSKSGAIEKYHEGQYAWSRKYRVTEIVKNGDDENDGKGESVISGSGTIAFQACDATICVPPKTLAFRLGDATGDESENGEDNNDDASDTLVVKLETCDATRPKVKLSVAGIMASVFIGGADVDRLRLKGTLSFDDQEVTVYLPRAREYTIENSEADDTRFSNQATFISVDQNGDGGLAEHESFASNLPVRIHDSMFRVTGINKKKKTISFQRIDGPLFGVVLNRRCPDFEFETVDGVMVTNESILGRATLLDIWAVT